MNSRQPLIAWDVYGNSDFAIQPAPLAREWMDKTYQRFAYRCLPLVIANQCGWLIHCPIGFTAKWNGKDDPGSIRFWYHARKKDARVSSHFGYGVLTFAVPYLFQTPPKTNLWVKGPTNRIKDSIQPLEGIVESDWIEATFTMNWKFTRPNVAVRFEKGEPFCMVLPMPRGLVESYDPQTRPLASDPERKERYERWRESRNNFNAALLKGDPETEKQGWQRNYMQGKDIDGKTTPEHQTRLSLRPFRKLDAHESDKSSCGK